MTISTRHESKGKKGVSRMKEIPKFKSENEEQQFWSEHDSTEFVDWSKAHRGVFPNLKPSTKTISLRLPETMLEELKLLANKKDDPQKIKG